MLHLLELHARARRAARWTASPSAAPSRLEWPRAPALGSQCPVKTRHTIPPRTTRGAHAACAPRRPSPPARPIRSTRLSAHMLAALALPAHTGRRAVRGYALPSQHQQRRHRHVSHVLRRHQSPRPVGSISSHGMHAACVRACFTCCWIMQVHARIIYPSVSCSRGITPLSRRRRIQRPPKKYTSSIRSRICGSNARDVAAFPADRVN